VNLFLGSGSGRNHSWCLRALKPFLMLGGMDLIEVLGPRLVMMLDALMQSALSRVSSLSVRARLGWRV
jgi:hypothetical protein